MGKKSDEWVIFRSRNEALGRKNRFTIREANRVFPFSVSLFFSALGLRSEVSRRRGGRREGREGRYHGQHFTFFASRNVDCVRCATIIAENSRAYDGPRERTSSCIST